MATTGLELCGRDATAEIADDTGRKYDVGERHVQRRQHPSRSPLALSATPGLESKAYNQPVHEFFHRIAFSSGAYNVHQSLTEGLATLAEQMIRGEQPQNDRNLRDLSDVLHVPVEWFTVPDLEEWLATRPSEGGQFERGELHAEVYEIRQLLSHVQDRLRHFDPTGETIGNG